MRLIFSFFFLTLLCFSSYSQQGSVDLSFNPEDSGYGYPITSGHVHAIVVQEDGKVIIAGNFTSFYGVPRRHIARLNEDGTLDESFDPGAGTNSPVNAMELLDDKILIAGAFSSYDGTPVNKIARLHLDGTLDESFGLEQNFNGSINSIAFKNDGKIIIGGSFSYINGYVSDDATKNIHKLALLNEDGSLVEDYNIMFNEYDYVSKVIYLGNDSVAIAGRFNYSICMHGFTCDWFSTVIIRNMNNPIPFFRIDYGANLLKGEDGANGEFRDLIADGNGVIAVGDFTFFDNEKFNNIIRFFKDGTRDHSFGMVYGGANNKINKIIRLHDGKFLVAGIFTVFDYEFRNHLARLNSNGTIDKSFNPGLGSNGEVYTVALKGDNNILVGGGFSQFDGKLHRCIALLDENGNNDKYFATVPVSGSNGFVYALGLQQDGKVVVGGFFNYINNEYRNKITRLNPDGTLDQEFNPDLNPNTTIRDIAVQQDGKIVVVGDFTDFSGLKIGGIVRLRTDGSIDGDFEIGQGADGNIRSVAIQKDGKIILVGNFYVFNDSYAPRIVRLNVDGSVDESFDVGIGFNNAAHCLHIQEDGKILVGGNFTTFNSEARSRIVRLNTNGSLDTSFDPGIGANNVVYSIDQQRNGRIILGGSFTSFMGVEKNRILRLFNDGSLDNTFNSGSGFNSTVYNVKVQRDNKVFASGIFESYNGLTANRLVRLNANGTLDTNFDTGSGADGPVMKVAIQQDNNILIAGNFTSFNEVGRNRVARILAESANATSILSSNIDLEIKLFPNPASQNVNLSIQNDTRDVVDILIVNSKGQVVWQENAILESGMNVWQLNLSGFSKGVYNIKVRGNKKLASSKLTIF